MLPVILSITAFFWFTEVTSLVLGCFRYILTDIAIFHLIVQLKILVFKSGLWCSVTGCPLRPEANLVLEMKAFVFPDNKSQCLPLVLAPSKTNWYYTFMNLILNILTSIYFI